MVKLEIIFFLNLFHFISKRLKNLNVLYQYRYIKLKFKLISHIRLAKAAFIHVLLSQNVANKNKQYYLL